VKAGHELVITERGLPIARILPLDVDQQKATRHERLVRAGVIRPGRSGGRVPKSILETPPVKISGVLDALLAERDEDYT
jgi:antitoxin (DNA-binding transcriptional repressor) of toxin-antitoxin stability system